MSVKCLYMFRIIKISFYFLFLIGLICPKTCVAQFDNQDSRVETLLSPLGHGTNETIIEQPERASKKYKEMVSKLRNPNSGALQLLMEEVTNIGVLEKKGKSGKLLGMTGDALYRYNRIYKAFQIAGTNAEPLFSQLTNEFLTGRSVYASQAGLLAIGTNTSMPVFIQGLTSSLPRVQVASAAVLRRSKGTNALSALPYLFGFATNRSAPEELRFISVQSLAQSGISPEVKIPALIQITQVDTNYVFKCLAIEGIGNIGVSNKLIHRFLEQEMKDSNRVVRLAATNVLIYLPGGSKRASPMVDAPK